VLALLTDVVNSGERFPALKVVTVPLDVLGVTFTHAVPFHCSTCPLVRLVIDTSERLVACVPFPR
jgi:hypothetical protein